MKIAFISLMNDAPWGGSEVLWSKTAALALSEGHEVLITAYRHTVPAPPLMKLVEAGARLFYRTAYRPELHLRIFRRLKRIVQPSSAELLEIQKFAPDRIFVNQGGFSDIIHKEDILAWLISGKTPYYIICHLYNDPIKLSDSVRSAILSAYQHAQEVFTISRLQTVTLERQLATALPNARVVQNPLNLPTHMPMPYPVVGIPQMAVVASLDADRKGHDVLFQVLSERIWQSRTWQLNIYGKGPDQAYLQRLADYYQVSSKINFHGHVSSSDEIWRTNHLIIIPSRIESGPMVLLEGMLSGRPIVSTNVGLVSDWLEEGVTGFIAEASLPDSLSKALDRSWAHQADWQAMGQRAFERASRQLESDPVRVMLDILRS